MDYKQKMMHHIAKAEEWHEEVVRLEKAAEVRALNEIAARQTFNGFGRKAKAARKLRAEDVAKRLLMVHMKQILDASLTYKGAVGNRNGHQEQAKMYGIAVQAMKSPTEKPLIPWEQCEDAMHGQPHAQHEWKTTQGRLLWCQGA
jgi:hypothetical protein